MERHEESRLWAGMVRKDIMGTLLCLSITPGAARLCSLCCVPLFGFWRFRSSGHSGTGLQEWHLSTVMLCSAERDTEGCEAMRFHACNYKSLQVTRTGTSRFLQAPSALLQQLTVVMIFARLESP